jgi:N12 class adenine-specific DNA methylase
MADNQALGFEAIVVLFTAREIRLEYNDLVDAIRQNILAPDDQSLEYFQESLRIFVEAFVRNNSHFNHIETCDMVDVFVSGYVDRSPELLKVIQDQNSPFR